MDTEKKIKCLSCSKDYPHKSIFPDDNLLFGDVYFKFTCAACNPTGSGNLITREPITWPIIIYLILYHLLHHNPTRKFFKMKEDICATITKHWNSIIPHKIRSSNWENTLSSALSTHPTYFVSGVTEMGQLGWWTLRTPDVPPPAFSPPGSQKQRRSVVHPPPPLPTLAPLSGQAQPDQIQSGIDSDTEFTARPTINKLTAAQIEAVVSKITKKRQFSLPLTRDQEWECCQELHSIIQQSKTSNPAIRRLFRKLYLRLVKDQLSLKQFDLDQCLLDYIKTKGEATPYQIPKQLTLSLNALPFISNPSLSYLGRYWNSRNDTETTEYIRRDWTNCPSKLATLRFFSNEIHPIDFVHLNDSLITPVNRFLCQFFWPGIDVSEFLSCSQFTIIAKYKKLIVGCAFMTVNPCYIPYLLVHPDWECAGIGTFMLFYLIGMSENRDITLHASASNNALMLYQKFGFKPEEFVVNFYDKYFHPSNTASKNAFFLRLKR